MEFSVKSVLCAGWMTLASLAFGPAAFGDAGPGDAPPMNSPAENEWDPIFHCEDAVCIDAVQVESRPTTYFRGEALILKRRRMDDRSYVNRWSDNERVLKTSAWTTPFDVGGRFTLGRLLAPRWAVEASGWWEDFEDSAFVVAPSGSIRQPFFNHSAYTPRPTIGELPARVDLECQSRVWSVEINLVRWFTDPDGPLLFGMIAGPRYFDYDETFQNYDSRTSTRGADPGDCVYETFVQNNMWGGQAGGFLGFQLGDRLGATLTSLWGGFYNDTEGTNQLRLQDDSVVWFRSTTPDDRFSGIVDLRFQAYARVRPCLWLYAGYQAMYFWNMTSAPDVLDFNLLKQSKANNELAFWVHGPTVGLEIRF